MEKFLLLIREDLKRVEEMPEDEMAACIQKMTDWVAELSKSGNFIQGDPLVTTGKYVSKNNILSDGPFIEAKEAISGFLFIKTDGLNQAAELAATCPLVLTGEVVIEVRPIMAIQNE
jgi:hypothetical protein